MLTRRSFTRLLAALPFVGGAAKAAGDEVTDSRYRIKAINLAEPRILYERPEQRGIPAASYFVPGDVTEAWLSGKGLTVRGFAGGQDVRCVAFEVDTAAGWVGIHPHYFIGDRLHLADCPRYWVAGEIIVTGKQQMLRPYAGAMTLSLDRLKSKIKYKVKDGLDGSDGRVTMKFTADVSEAKREYDRFVAEVRNMPAR